MLMSPNTKVLVTGGAGFIGSHLVEALVAGGCSVKVIDNLSTGHLSNLEKVKDQIDFVKGDIRDRDLLIAAGEGIDILFHQAAVVSVPFSVKDPVGSAMVNEIGTLNVLEAARQNGVGRVVMAGSCAVYGNQPLLPKRENMTPRPESPYALQKLTGELYADLYRRLYGVQVLCLRYFNVYGPRQDPSSPYSGVISIFMTRAAKNQPAIIYGDGRQYRDFVFVKDVVQANLLAADAGLFNSGTFNIGTGSFVRIAELWEMVAKMAGSDLQPEYREKRAGDVDESYADIHLAKQQIGFTPGFSFEEGLKQTFEWYQTEYTH